MNRIEFDSIWWNKYEFSSYRETTCAPREFLYEIGITQHLTQHPADKQQEQNIRAAAYIIACPPPPASVLFSAAQARKLPLAASLGGGRRKP